MHNHFHKIGRKYYLTDYLGIFISQMEYVSLIFHVLENGVVVLKKYGSTPSVMSWYERNEQDYPHKTGDYLLIFGSDKWEVEDLNKLLKDVTYAQTFYLKLKESHAGNNLHGLHSDKVAKGNKEVV